MICRKYFFNCY